MSTKDELILWLDAIKSYEEGHDEIAISSFKIVASSSKIFFNIGMVYVRKGDWHSAIEYLSRAISYDCYLSVAYFVRGGCEYALKRYDEALLDYEESAKLLRGNSFIDYKQLGLDFVLKEIYVDHNLCLCLLHAGKPSAARQLVEDIQVSLDPEDELYPVIKETCRWYETAHKDSIVIQLKSNHIFKPSSSKVQNMEEVDYIGSSTVIATVNANDTYSGFSGKYLKKTGTLKTTNSRSNSEPNLPRRKMSFAGHTPSLAQKPKDLPIFTARKTSLVENPYASQGNNGNYNLSPLKTSSNMHNSPVSGHLNLFSPPSARRKPSSAELWSASTSSPSKRHVPDVMDTTILSPTRIATDTSGQIHVKIHYNQPRMFLLPYDSTFDLLYNKVLQKLRMKQGVRLCYKDDEGELCGLHDDEDLQLAFMHSGIELKSLDHRGGHRLNIWCFDSES